MNERKLLHLRSFESFANDNKYKMTNEGILSSLFNLFKKAWDGLSKDLEALGENPDPKKVETTVAQNVIDPNGKNSLLKTLLDTFNKKTDINDMTCLDTIKDYLDPKVGSLSDDSIKQLADGLSKADPNNKTLPATITYIISSARNQAIAKFKYAGGPSDGKTDDTKITADLKDANHLPDLKKILTADGQDNNKKKIDTANWMTNTLVPFISNAIKNISPDNIVNYLKSQNIEQQATMNYDTLKDLQSKKTPVIYLLKDKTMDDWNKLSDESKKNPTTDEKAKEVVGVKELADIDSKKDDNVVIFNDKDGKPTIEKKYEEIIGASPEVPQTTDGDTEKAHQDATTAIDTIKNNADLLKNTTAFINYINNPENKDKLPELYKSLGIETPTQGGQA